MSTAITKLTTIIDIRDWLREQDRLSHSSTSYGITGLEQFAIDWIEEEIDRAEQYLESEEITVDDVTFVGAIHYRADCVLEVLRTDCNCYRFFAQLVELT